ncbi:hypothetical protein IV203_021298 [Nitzschia inconspicua]|uniref:Uncharacterized protein n=1 Tax=Nitzschia inconspicua TaxID=303405 RepID=A0A9K3KIB2_9STRA|nr:hypothetical protein IV203_021298 [Nitzschia inconspicua]
MNQKKRVTFGLQQTAYFAPPSSSNDCEAASQEHQRRSTWYSDRELQQSRDEARTCVLFLQQRLHQEGDQHSSLSIDALEIPCPNDPSQTLCLRGIEKYADAAAKFAGQKRHVGSVLRQQSLDNKEEHVALVSRTLSQPFKDVARYYAMKSAEEQEALRKQETEQRDVAQAIVMMLASKPHEKTHPRVVSSSDLVEDGRSTPPEMVSTKRSLPSHHLHHCRNVKPCIRVISE